MQRRRGLFTAGYGHRGGQKLLKLERDRQCETCSKVGEYPIAHLHEIEDKGRLDPIHFADCVDHTEMPATIFDDAPFIAHWALSGSSND